MTSELKLDKGADVVVVHDGIKATFNASGMTVNVQGATITIDQNGRIITRETPSNDRSGAAAQKVHEVGEHPGDGTVCIAVDLEHNEARFAPEGIFGGSSDFDHQDGVVERVNAQKLHGYEDWCMATDEDASALVRAWNEVAPEALQGSAAPWFWLASPNSLYLGRVRRGGEADWYLNYRGYSLPVPVVRSGPARS